MHLLMVICTCAILSLSDEDAVIESVVQGHLSARGYDLVIRKMAKIAFLPKGKILHPSCLCA